MHGVCAQTGVALSIMRGVFPPALPSSPPSCPCDPTRVQPLMAINAKEVFCPQHSRTRTRHGRTEKAPGERGPATCWPDQQSEGAIDAPLTSSFRFHHIPFVDVFTFAAMWMFGCGGQRRSLRGRGGSRALLCVFAFCFCQGCSGLQVGTGGGQSGLNASEFSVPVVLLLTETGIAQNGASEGATAAPTSQHEDDNSLGYTGTAAAAVVLL